MASTAPKSFTALLERDGTALNWVIVRVPFDPAKVWPERVGRRVRGSIGGFGFRTTLFPGRSGGGPFLVVNKTMQTGAGVRVGDKARITLEADLEERSTETPAELAKELKASRRLEGWYLRLSPSMRREIGKWITEPKSAASREKRAARMAERLMQTMEGETDPPPVLRAAFERQPAARAGWLALTATQRRNHLLGIFYYESVEGRERRAAKAIEEALRAARKGGRGRATF